MSDAETIQAIKAYFAQPICPCLKETMDAEGIDETDKSVTTQIRLKDCCWWEAQKAVTKILEAEE